MKMIWEFRTYRIIWKGLYRWKLQLENTEYGFRNWIFHTNKNFAHFLKNHLKKINVYRTRYYFHLFYTSSKHLIQFQIFSIIDISSFTRRPCSHEKWLFIPFDVTETTIKKILKRKLESTVRNKKIRIHHELLLFVREKVND